MAQGKKEEAEELKKQVACKQHIKKYELEHGEIKIND